MTRDDLLAEQFGHGTTDHRALPAWTEADQERHRDTLAAAINLGMAVRRIRAHVLANLTPTPATRQQLIDDLPPDSRPGHTLIVRAR